MKLTRTGRKKKQMKCKNCHFWYESPENKLTGVCWMREIETSYDYLCKYFTVQKIKIEIGLYKPENKNGG